MKKRIDEIRYLPYGQYVNGKPVKCEPSSAEIADAVNKGAIASQAFQNPELLAKLQQADIAEVRKYHAQRIAYFVVNGWSEPIVLQADGSTMKDGLHRLLAAVFNGEEEVEVEISD